MRLTILGSAAAEAVPALWCECDVCATALQRGGKDIRRRSCYLIDDDTMVDFGPDAFWQTMQFNINLPALQRLVFTHPHLDHLNPVELCWRRRGYSKVTKPLTVIGPPTVFHAIMAQTANSGVACDFTELQLHRVEVSPGREITDGDMTILPIAANHAPGKAALVYVFRRNGKSLLIANDTGWLTDESWEVLRSQSLDAAVIECTSSLKYPDQRNHHMGANTTVAFRDQLRNIGCLKPDAIVVTNHFSHNGNSLHQVLEDFFVPKGIAVAYDGMVITF